MGIAPGAARYRHGFSGLCPLAAYERGAERRLSAAHARRLRSERERRVSEALARVGLNGFAERKPSGLSGGQQQRVALARAIVAAPRVLLFDEPLSNTDSELRESLCGEMSRLLRQLGITALYVTHDRREAELLADQIVYLSAGRVAAVRAVTPTSGEVA